MKKLLALLPLLLALTGCSIVPHIPILNHIYSGPTTKETRAVSKAQVKTDKEQAELDAYKDELTTKLALIQSNRIELGSAFVYGTGKALERAPQNDPAVKLAESLNADAQQALPKPSTQDTVKVDKAVTEELSGDSRSVDQGEEAIAALRERLARTEAQLASTQAHYAKDIADAQADRDSALAKERAAGSKAAVKANKFDEANSLWGSTKLFFSNGIHVFFSLVIFGIVGWLVWQAGKIAAAIYCPPVALGMNSVEGMTSKEVAAGFTQVISGGKKFLAAVEQSDLLPEAKAKIQALFTSAHKEAQDLHIQDAVKKLIQPHA